MELIAKTGVRHKQTGDPLLADDINAINERLNETIDTVNSLLLGYCDINREAGTLGMEYKLSDAINLVPESRRVLGIKIRFLNTYGRYAEYSYIGEDTSPESWGNTDNWLSGIDILDGGSW